MAHMRYAIFAEIAEKEGLKDIANFSELSLMAAGLWLLMGVR